MKNDKLIDMQARAHELADAIPQYFLSETGGFVDGKLNPVPNGVVIEQLGRARGLARELAGGLAAEKPRAAAKKKKTEAA